MNKNEILSLVQKVHGLKKGKCNALPENREAGRICDLTVGTYENACTYVHAGTFGAAALFITWHPRKHRDLRPSLIQCGTSPMQLLIKRILPMTVS